MMPEHYMAFAICLPFALFPALLYFRNVRLFQAPSRDATVRERSVSVLIPARNEEISIRACVECVLANGDFLTPLPGREGSEEAIELECLVLDDGSTDATAAIVSEIAAKDPRVKLLTAPPLPDGWAGKQHACFELSKQAKYPLFCFLDADVKLAPDALIRMIGFLHSRNAALVSGFPRQETKTLLEKLLLPLIHFILLGFLPLARMRASTDPRFGAGCGQFFLTTREAYETVGGHEVIKASFHDGIQLPRAYRRKGFHTDICDATAIATCRMYRTNQAVWNGLAKNAREGMATPIGLPVWSCILGTGHVLPFLCALLFGLMRDFHSMAFLLVVCGFSLAPRFDAAIRYHQPLLGALLHPLGTFLLLLIQWYAAIRHWIGKPIGWKSRALPEIGS